MTPPPNNGYFLGEVKTKNSLSKRWKYNNKAYLNPAKGIYVTILFATFVFDDHVIFL